MTKTIYTHKSKGTKLTLVEAVDAKTSIVLNEEGVEMPVANITLSRWYNVEVVEDQPTIEDAVKTEEAEVKRNGSKMIKYEDVVEAAGKAISIVAEGIDTDIFTYTYGKSLRAEAIIHLDGNIYRLGSVLNPTNGKVVSSYYLVNDSKDGLESIQRKGVKAAAEALSSVMALNVDQITAVISESRRVAQEEIQ